MGGVKSCYESSAADDGEPVLVTLHIYDVAQASPMLLLNRLLSVWGTGAFHAGVEVYEKEWSFGAGGLCCCSPMAAQGHAYKESVHIGHTMMSEQRVLLLLKRLSTTWRGADYNMLKMNCCHFSDAFCQALTGHSVPERLKTLAATGAAIADGGASLVNQVVRRKSFTERVLGGLVGNVCAGSGGSCCGQGIATAARRKLTWDSPQAQRAVSAR